MSAVLVGTSVASLPIGPVTAEGEDGITWGESNTVSVYNPVTGEGWNHSKLDLPAHFKETVGGFTMHSINDRTVSVGTMVFDGTQTHVRMDYVNNMGEPADTKQGEIEIKAVIDGVETTIGRMDVLASGEDPTHKYEVVGELNEIGKGLNGPHEVRFYAQKFPEPYALYFGTGEGENITWGEANRAAVVDPVTKEGWIILNGEEKQESLDTGKFFTSTDYGLAVDQLEGNKISVGKMTFDGKQTHVKVDYVNGLGETLNTTQGFLQLRAVIPQASGSEAEVLIGEVPIKASQNDESLLFSESIMLNAAGRALKGTYELRFTATKFSKVLGVTFGTDPLAPDFAGEPEAPDLTGVVTPARDMEVVAGNGGLENNQHGNIGNTGDGTIVRVNDVNMTTGGREYAFLLYSWADRDSALNGTTKDVEILVEAADGGETLELKDGSTVTAKKVGTFKVTGTLNKPASEENPDGSWDRYQYAVAELTEKVEGTVDVYLRYRQGVNITLTSFQGFYDDEVWHDANMVSLPDLKTGTGWSHSSLDLSKYYKTDTPELTMDQVENRTISVGKLTFDGTQTHVAMEYHSSLGEELNSDQGDFTIYAVIDGKETEIGRVDVLASGNDIGLVFDVAGELNETGKDLKGEVEIRFNANKFCYPYAIKFGAGEQWPVRSQAAMYNPFDGTGWIHMSGDDREPQADTSQYFVETPFGMAVDIKEGNTVSTRMTFDGTQNMVKVFYCNDMGETPEEFMGEFQLSAMIDGAQRVIGTVEWEPAGGEMKQFEGTAYLNEWGQELKGEHEISIYNASKFPKILGIQFGTTKNTEDIEIDYSQPGPDAARYAGTDEFMDIAYNVPGTGFEGKGAVFESGGNVGYTTSGTVLRVNDVDFTSLGRARAYLYYSSDGSEGTTTLPIPDENGTESITLDDGTVVKCKTIGSLQLENRRNWSDYRYAWTELTEEVTGTHDVYIKLGSGPNVKEFAVDGSWSENASDPAVDAVIEGIRNIPSPLTYDDKEYLLELQAQYEALTAAQKARVYNYSVLEDALGRIESLKDNPGRGATYYYVDKETWEIVSDGPQFENNSGGNGWNIGYTGATEDVLKIKDVDFGTDGFEKIFLEYANNEGTAGEQVGYIEVKIDTGEGFDYETAEVAARFFPYRDGKGWNSYKYTYDYLRRKITGVHDVYLIFHNSATNVRGVAFEGIGQDRPTDEESESLFNEIVELPNEIAYTDKEYLLELRARYDALTDEQKKNVPNISRVDDFLARVDKLILNPVTDGYIDWKYTMAANPDWKTLGSGDLATYNWDTDSFSNIEFKSLMPGPQILDEEVENAPEYPEIDFGDGMEYISIMLKSDVDYSRDMSGNVEVWVLDENGERVEKIAERIVVGTGQKVADEVIELTDYGKSLKGKQKIELWFGKFSDLYGIRLGVKADQPYISDPLLINSLFNGTISVWRADNQENLSIEYFDKMDSLTYAAGRNALFERPFDITCWEEMDSKTGAVRLMVYLDKPLQGGKATVLFGTGQSLKQNRVELDLSGQGLEQGWNEVIYYLQDMSEETLEALMQTNWIQIRMEGNAEDVTMGIGAVQMVDMALGDGESDLMIPPYDETDSVDDPEDPEEPENPENPTDPALPPENGDEEDGEDDNIPDTGDRLPAAAAVLLAVSAGVTARLGRRRKKR